MEDNKLERRKLAVTKLELTVDKFLTAKRKEILAEPIKTRFQVERVRKEYMLNQNTIDMFNGVGMITEYTTLLKKFNRLLDGDLS